MKLKQWTAFQPPSDMSGGASGGGSSKKIWTFLGVGCGFFLLVCGIFLALGGFKMMQCCDAAQESAIRMNTASNFGAEFIGKLQRGDIDAAHADLSPTFQQRMTKEKLKTVVDAQNGRLVGHPALVNSQARHRSDTKSVTDVRNFALTYSIAGNASERATVVDLEVNIDDAGVAKVTAFNVEERTRNLASEPAAQTVIKFHETLQRGNTSFAYGLLGQQFKEKTDVATFEKFIEETGTMLTDSTMEIRAVDYAPSGATIMAQTIDSSGKSAIVQFELATVTVAGFSGYEIVAIAPMVAQH